MFLVMLSAFVFLLFIGLTATAVAFDTQRALALMRRSPNDIARYRCQLPNVLAVLARAGLPAGPDRVSGLSIYRFKRRLRRLMLHADSRTLVDSHLGLWLYVEDRRDLLNLALSTATARLARRICEVGGDVERECYGSLLLRSQERQQKLYAALQRQFGARCLTYAERVLAEMRSIEIVFEEHGYHIHEGFSPLRKLEEALAPAVYAA